MGWQGRTSLSSYVKGWDPKAGAWVERIYYAGAAENLGDHTRFAFRNGTVNNRSLSRNLPSFPTKTGNAEASTNPTSCTTMANGKCGTLPGPIMKTI